MKKVLAILASSHMYGKERSNIEVYNLLKKNREVKFSVIANRKADDRLLQAMDNLSPRKIVCPDRHSPKHRLLTYAYTYIIGNVQLLCQLLRFRPDALMMCGEIDFYNFYPALLFYHGRILYRIGDAPSFEGLSFHAYNSHVWHKYILPRVTRFVCISRYIKKTIEDAGRDTTNDKIIYNYPPARRQVAATDESMYRQVPDDVVVFGYIGQIFEQKGVHHYIECALDILKDSPSSMFYMAGSLDLFPAYTAQLKAMIPERYKENIVFLGEVDNIEAFFRHIDVLCVPSIKQEPLGNVLVEAKKYGKPCVIYPSGGMPELISHKVDGFVCRESSAAALLEGMRYYAFDKPLAVRHGEASLKSVATLGIDRENFERKWNEVFDEILG